MQIKNQRILPNGKKQMTVIVDTNEQLISINESLFYRLGGELNDIVPGFVITDSCQISWCHIQQNWIPE